MSDLYMYEFEDTVWGDHIVPYPGSEYDCIHSVLDSDYKKPRDEVTKVTSCAEDRYVGTRKEGGFPIMSEKKSVMLDKSALSRIQPSGVQPSSCDSELMKEASTSASDNDSSLCFKNSNTDLNGGEFCDTILSRKTSAVGNNSLSYPLGNVAQTGNNVDLLGNAEEKDPDDFLYYGWPEIGNFEGVDNMLRSCDSTFVEDDLGWFSSADIKSNCRSPSPVSKMAENLSENHKSSNCYSVDDFSMTSEATRHKNSSWASKKSDSYMSFVNGPANAHDRNEAIHKEQCLEFNSKLQPGIASSSHGSIITGGETINEPRKQPNLQNQGIGKTEEDLFGNGSFSYNSSLSSELLQLSSGATSYLASPYMCIQEKRIDSGSGYVYQQNPVPYAQKNNCLLFNPPSENLILSTVNSEANGSSQLTAVDWNGNREKKHNCRGANLVVPVELGLPYAQESSTLSSGSDDISAEVASFRQLNVITEKLDLRTKLCIRDSLYRLARSAEQRHNHLSGVLMADSFMDMETDTNPIDRSVAHLLFHRPSESSTIPMDSVLLNSPAMVHGSATGVPVCKETASKMKILTDG